MNTEDNMENGNGNSLGLRIAVGSGLVATGCAIVGPTMTNILQAELVPCWAVVLGAIGLVAIIAGLSILIVPFKRWKRLGQCIVGFPVRCKETKIWNRYGPACTLGEPNITFKLLEDRQAREYTATISLSINSSEKAHDYYPIKILLDNKTTKFRLEQSRGGVKVPNISLELVDASVKQILISVSGITPINLVFSLSPYNNPAMAFIDIQKASFEWIIEGIEVRLANINKVRKLSKRGKGFNTEREVSKYASS